MFKLPKDMTNKELLKEYEAYDQMIHVIGCFGTKDVMWFDEVCREMDRREE